MFSIAHLFYGLLAVAVGIAGLKWNYQIVGFTGRQDWIESKLGAGSTYLAYKLFCGAIIICGMLYGLGLADNVFEPILSPLKQIFPAPKS